MADEEIPSTPGTPNAKCRLSLKCRLVIKALSAFWTVKLCQLLCTVYILLMTFTKAGTFGSYGGLVNPETGTIIDPYSVARTEAGVIFVNGDMRPVVAENTFQMVCLAFSRASAFSCYPVLILVYLSKCRGLISFLGNTPFYLYMFQDMHELHIYAGKYIFVDGLIHTLFHIYRWCNQGNLYLMTNHRTGITGIIAAAVLLLITLPMIYFKNTIKYELRKLLHYLFFVMAVALAMHVPPSAIPNGGFAPFVFSIVIGIYTLDAVYVYFFMTEKIETTIFQKLPSGCQMTLRVSDRFQHRGTHGGYAYACLPWIDKHQWHAFSLFENPRDPNERQIFLLKCGDWTNQVHAALKRNTVRPMYIMGPFSSPYNNADAYDNQIMVATGIGITPALSIIRAHKDSRRTNLIWAVRDVSMLEFFLEHLYLDHDGWNLIFYTGRDQLNPALEELNTNVRIVKSRPDLKVTILNIIYGIESKNGVPETYLPEQVEKVEASFVELMGELDKTNLTKKEKLVRLTELAQSHGFLCGDLLASLEARRHHRRNPSSHSEDSPLIERDEESLASDDDSVRTNLSLAGKECSSSDESSPLEALRELDDGTTESKRLLYASQPSRRRLTWDCRLSSSPSLTCTFNPWEKNPEASDFVKSLDKDAVLCTWGMLYCGGNEIVEDELKAISEEYHLALHVESFQW